jgi:hypothetical protein
MNEKTKTIAILGGVSLLTIVFIAASVTTNQTKKHAERRGIPEGWFA